MGTIDKPRDFFDRFGLSFGYVVTKGIYYFVLGRKTPKPNQPKFLLIPAVGQEPDDPDRHDWGVGLAIICAHRSHAPSAARQLINEFFNEAEQRCLDEASEKFHIGAAARGIFSEFDD